MTKEQLQAARERCEYRRSVAAVTRHEAESMLRDAQERVRKHQNTIQQCLDEELVEAYIEKHLEALQAERAVAEGGSE